MAKIELIKASAGSGKTHELMDRLSECIASGTQPERLLATTFTVKAAAELQSRIRQKLLEDKKPDLASQVFDGLIGTVNSVCGKLLSEYAIEAGLSPALTVLSEENADIIFSAAISSVTNQYAEKLESIATKLSMNPIKENTHNSKTIDWKNDVRKILDLARSNRLSKSDLIACGEQSVKSLKELFPAEENLSLENICDRIASCSNFQANGKSTKDALKSIQSFLRFPTWEGVCKLTKISYAKKKDPEFPIEIFQELDSLLLKTTGLYEDMAAMIRGVFACAGDSLEAYAQYKKDFGLVDFVDQECGVLSMLENNPNFVQLMKERLSQIMVDEFQDTSPIQLALFLKLNDCSAKGSVWVGDPKQAIYGFRGTDPELMDAVANTISDPQMLENSWRSKENLVKLSNEIFTRAFTSMKPEDVTLEIPDERKAEAAGGIIEAWHIIGTSAQKRIKSIAAGIAELIRDKGVTPNQICLLLRRNEDCSEMAKALAEWNITASAPSDSLLDTEECQLVMAAFRYCIDSSDTSALAVLLALCGEMPDCLDRLHRAKTAWLKLSKEEQKKTDFLKEIREIEFLKELRRKADATPMEILEYVITELNLDGKISAMNSSDHRMSNMDKLRRLCQQYTDQALVERRAATPAGFVAALNSAKANQATGSGPNTVNVMTYHKSKGLEWPIVILGDLNLGNKNSAFSIFVNQAETFDVEHPLKNRTIHYWPYPFGGQQKIEPLENKLAQNPIQKHAKKRGNEEGKRLLYVGLTRAKDQVIFALDSKLPSEAELNEDPNAGNTLSTAWLDSLAASPLLTFPLKEGSGNLSVGEASFPIETRIFYPDQEIVPLPSPIVFADKKRDISNIRTVPARLLPSGEKCDDGTAVLLCRWDHTSVMHCEEGKYDLLGNAFHNFIALNPQQDRRAIAERLLKNWTVEKGVSPETLMECTDHLYSWIAGTYPGAKISCEIPMTYHDENGTLYQGFIDMLLELPDGYVIIDHKTHPMAFDAESFAARCAGQLRLYRKAVEAAAGKPVRQTIIHLPNLGMCFEVK